VQIGFKVKDTASSRLLEETTRILQMMQNRLELAAGHLWSEMRKNIEALPHYSLKELAEMGHPYAVRAPSTDIHDPIWQVHVQSGQLIRSLTTSQIGVSPFGFEIRVGIPESSPAFPYALHVIHGTKDLMVPRNFITGTVNDNLEIISGILRGRVK